MYLHYVWFLLTLYYTNGQELPEVTVNDEFGRAIKCKRGDGLSQRCMPVFENIAFGRDIVANNTCGVARQQEYCVQTGVSGAAKICENCDANDAKDSHPANLMTDLKFDNIPTWWQSETLLDNKFPVYLTLTLNKKYNVAFIRVRFHTIRPHSFAIYKKSTYVPDEEWLPYQFYSSTCEKTYQLPNRGAVSQRNQKIALCTDEASGMIPLSGGNVAYLTLDHRPGKNDFDRYPELQQWVTVTALRFNLDQLNTFGDEVFGDPKVLRSYYFAISDIAVGGRCKCNGHASTCNNNNNEGVYQCDCDHNTAGKDCEKCLPLYNEIPWRRASGRSAYPCKACNCNNLADECVFDTQLWVDSNRRSGGRCVGCKNNTAGINCERCKEYHFRSNDKEACKPCGCNQLGSRSLSCNTKGDCLCQRGVVGKKCDKCKEGYYGFSSSGCRECNCDSDGSIGIDCSVSGQCKCKENSMGKRCDQCKPNYFDLDESNPKGCKQCFCYGHGSSCSALEGYGKKVTTSTFEADFDGWKLQDREGNDYSSNMDWDFRGQYIYILPHKTKELYLVAPQSFLGNKLSSYAKSFSFLYGIFRSESDPDIRPSANDIIFEGDSLTTSYMINDQNNEIPAARFTTFNYKLVEPEGMSTFNFQRLLSNLTAIKLRVTYLSRRGAIDNIKLDTAHFVSINSPEQVTWQEKCECKKGYSGVQCENCESGFTREGGIESPFKECVPCNCNNHGSSCDPDTGKCVCNHNTTGDQCEQCLPGFYGNPSRGNEDDCKPCPCIFGNECILIGDRIKCTDCPPGHVGDKCEKCSDGYFGNPEGVNGIQSSCQKCDCNGNVDSNSIGNCNSLTGGCLKCINNTKNGDAERCELCDDGFYGNATIEPKGNCSACNCFANGTVRSDDKQNGDSIPCDQNGKCSCLDNVTGDRCDQCPVGYWNVASGNGCEKCNCDSMGSVGSECNLETGQCMCKPGVGGRSCDRCAAGHFKFTKDGCTACNCHPDGSKHQNCTADGVCECLKGVLGLKCDQCPENKFNLSVGCIACPKCFELIQVAVNRLREKLSSFNFTSEAGNNTDPGIDIKDEDFEKLLKKYEKLIMKLAEKTEKLSIGEMELREYFESLTSLFERLVTTIEELKTLMEKSEGASKTGQVEIGDAEDIIELIKALLNQGEEQLAKQGNVLFNNSTGGDASGMAKRMKEIAEKARKLADKHESDSKVIESNTDMAFNNSNSAYKTAREARDKEENLNQKLKESNKDSKEAELLAKESRELLRVAKAKSLNATDEAHRMINQSKEDFPTVHPDLIKEKAENLSNESASNIKESTDLVTENEAKVEQLKKDDMEARDLIEKGMGLHNQSNELYRQAKNASDEAKKAQEDGLRVAKQGQEMLETLLKFNERIAASKANATEAMKLIDLIKQLIKEANETGMVASKNAETAETQAMESFQLASWANKTTVSTRQDIDDIMEQARKLLNETETFMQNQLVETKNDIKITQTKLDELKSKAEEDSSKIQTALNKTEEGKNKATLAENDLIKALDNVEDLMVLIDSLPEIDFQTLEDAEDRFKKAKEIIEGNIQDEIDLLEKKSIEQEQLIKQYELDLDPLRKQIQMNSELFEYIPKSCFRKQGGLETVSG